MMEWTASSRKSGEIKISGITDEQLNVRIETGGTEIFNESYYALKGNVVIHEIGEMLRSHVLPA